MRVSGEGEPGKRGGAYGDLYVYIIVEGDPDFERDGDDLYKAINISFTTAALGSTIQVETLVKKVELKIPAGTQSGTRFRISGEGMPHLQSSPERQPLCGSEGDRPEETQRGSEGSTFELCPCMRRRCETVQGQGLLAG